MSMVGNYTLELYCDNYDYTLFGEIDYSTDIRGIRSDGHIFNDFPHEYIDEFGSKCRAKARKAGWLLNVKTGAAICPKCAKKGLKLE